MGGNLSGHSLESLEAAVQVFFSDQSEVGLAYLFGSYVSRPSGPVNDIDIAVLVSSHHLTIMDRTMPYGYRADLLSKLARLLSCDKVDLVLLNHASPVLLRQVIGKGKLIFCRSDVDRICFEVASLKRHADTAHIRRIKRFYMKQRIEKGLTAYARP